jgi:hypothetical protein
MSARTLLRAVAAAAAVLAGPASLSPSAPLPIARAEEDWRREFDDLCGKTQDAMTLPSAELEGLVKRCDALQPKLDALGETERKVFSRRLKACRDLYQFVIDTREK